MTTKTAPHFFIASNGDLFDTRRPDWSACPLRKNYRFQHGKISSGRKLRNTLRAGPYAWPGGYPLYFITSDGGALSFQTVRENLRSVLDSIRHKSNDGWRVIACEVNWEDENLYDDHTGEKIESAYGENENE